MTEYMQRFREGDVICIKSRDEIDAYINKHNSIPCGWADEMYDYCDQYCTVTEVWERSAGDGFACRIQEDDGEWVWHDVMIRDGLIKINKHNLQNTLSNFL